MSSSEIDSLQNPKGNIQRVHFGKWKEEDPPPPRFPLYNPPNKDKPPVLSGLKARTVRPGLNLPKLGHALFEGFRPAKWWFSLQFPLKTSKKGTNSKKRRATHMSPLHMARIVVLSHGHQWLMQPSSEFPYVCSHVPLTLLKGTLKPQRDCPDVENTLSLDQRT